MFGAAPAGSKSVVLLLLLFVISSPCSDAFYDRGSTFPVCCFLNGGVLQPKIVGMPILFRKMTFLYTFFLFFSTMYVVQFLRVDFVSGVRLLECF